MIKKQQTFTPNVLDVEASGFGPDSYPIEVGVITAQGERFCRLIKPLTNWKHWSEEAQALHGIERCTLMQHGKEPAEVCCQLNELLRGQTIYTDGWVVDYPWMIRLYEAAATTMAFRVSPLEALLSEYQMTHWAEVRKKVFEQQMLTRHRASSDAECVQQVFMQTRLAQQCQASASPV